MHAFVGSGGSALLTFSAPLPGLQIKESRAAVRIGAMDWSFPPLQPASDLGFPLCLT